MSVHLTAGSAAELAAELAVLPPGFQWGVATSAYQIEGAVNEDGRTPSIWDTYAHTPGAIADHTTGDVACDHYHRMPEDVALIASLGVNTYRFSIAWPRVQPGGSGPVNPRGIGFYDRLVDELLRRDIQPWVTLYHWDLPQELEDAGGWPSRDTAHRFADYAAATYAALGDRVRDWTTLNEPWCQAMLGYAYAQAAPGRSDFPAAIRAVHHQLLGHGLAAQAIRADMQGPLNLGITLNLSDTEPASDDPADIEAARRADGLWLRIYLDPLMRGRYPADVLDDLAARSAPVPVLDGDCGIIAAPLDVLGVNYYTASVEASDGARGRGLPVTAMGWEVYPQGLTDLLLRLHRDYPGVPLVVTENGAAFDDVVDPTGFVDDPERTGYLAAHIRAVARAAAQGVDVRGYFAWSLMDNFEWGQGNSKRFGLVAVDYASQRRSLKRSGAWFRDLLRHASAADGREGSVEIAVARDRGEAGG
ncbi:MAG TPA: GH1 family beta-glucosidase [Rugosimonospora sp.]